MSAAELSSIVNEAALLAARHRRRTVTVDDVDEAVDRVLSGTPASRIMSAEEKRVVAAHEAGHALLTLLVKGMRPPPRISVVSRAGTFDRSIWIAGADREVQTKHELLAQLIVLLGGRAAEQLLLGQPSTRAEDDLGHAASLARRMVRKWAMTGRYDLAGGGDEGSAPMHEGSAGAEPVRQLIAHAERAALTILGDHRPALIRITEALARRETLTAAEVERLSRSAAAALANVVDLPSMRRA